MVANFIVRKVKKDDMKMVFELSNQEYVRKYSIKKEEINWLDHTNWFNKAINDSNLIFYIITNVGNEVIGQVRFEILEKNAIVSISVAESILGKGYSQEILKKSLALLFEEMPTLNKVTAYIEDVNYASIKLFERVGFRLIERKSHLLMYILQNEELCEDEEFRK